MQKYRVELSARAERDLREAYAYIGEHGPANPDAWKAGLEEKIALLESMPMRCGIAPEDAYREPEIRQTFYGKYRIIFTIRYDIVYIISIRHGARLPLAPDELGDV